MTSSIRKITKRKSHLQSSVFWLNQTKITHSTGNEFFYGQSRWILIWSTGKNVMKDKSWMYLRHLTSSLRKITKHKSYLQSSVFCLNKTKIPHSTGNEFSMVNPGGFWFEAQVKMLWRIKAWMRAWMCLRHLTSRLIKITKHKSHLQSSVFCLNRTKITHSTGNYFFYGQSRWILIWSINKNVMKDKSLNMPTTLDIAPEKNHKTQISSYLQSSVSCLNKTKITHSTGNDFFYGQSRWILIWSTNEYVMKDKRLNVSTTLDIAPEKNHKIQISSAIVCFLL